MSDQTNNTTNTNQPSTAQSYLDSAIGTVQSAIGSLTGSNDDKASGEQRKADAQNEYDASHATFKGPGFAASSSGAVTRDDPDRAAGGWNQTMGSAKETVGGLVGSASLKAAGREQNRNGQEQEARGQAKDLVSGVADRATGALGSGMAGLTGNRGAQEAYQKQHAAGKTQQRGAELDIQQQNEAERARGAAGRRE